VHAELELLLLRSLRQKGWEELKGYCWHIRIAARLWKKNIISQARKALGTLRSFTEIAKDGKFSFSNLGGPLPNC
jgi:hypothetical protein